MQRRFIFVSLFLLVSIQLFAQIVDDTTKEVYGTTTTRYFLQDDLDAGAIKKRMVDTSLQYLHYYNYQIKSNAWYQNLGNLGTPMKSIYYQAPTQLGYRLGFEAFHPYLQSPLEQRYFDTKSPYSELYLLQGGNGEQRLYLLFTRNVNRYWNLGASYNRLTSTKQLAVVQQRDFQADHHQINVFSSVHSKNRKYNGVVHFNYMQHWAYESGGIKPQEPTENIIDSGLYLYKYANVRLFRSNFDAARNYYRTTNLHLYHQYNPLDSGRKELQVFHELDWKRENQYYRDNNMLLDRSFDTFYGGVYFGDTIKSFYQYKYELLQNRVGIKGGIGQLDYSLFYRNRMYSLVDTSQDPLTAGKPKKWFRDAFAGGSLKYGFTDFYIRALGERMVTFSSTNVQNDSNYVAHHDYRWEFSMGYKRFTLEAEQVRTSPTLMQSRMVYNLAKWSFLGDSLSSVTSQRVAMKYLAQKQEKLLLFELAYHRIDNLIYFRSMTVDSMYKVVPVQERGSMDYVQPRVLFRTNYRWLFFENDLVLTHVFTDKEVIHMPRWFTMPKIYYQSKLFKGATELQAGVELFLRANYYADAYAPHINQYYWQNSFEVKTFPITNVFLNFKLSRARLFLKVTNLFGDPNFQTGYFETPYYTGMRRSFQFGIAWRAFD